MMNILIVIQTIALILSATITLPATVSSGIPNPVETSENAAYGFVHADGSTIIGTDGKPFTIKGMALGNSVYLSDTEPNPYHHTENTYRELSELGFNSVRFYLNYTYFESDRSPYQYKESGFEWLDENIAWAKKYGMGIILNMHYPQGGYQSQGNGMALWLETEYQNRLTSLWKEIATRYADEPTIWGYGLLNEPVVPVRDTMEETILQYKNLMNKLITTVRKASPNQAIFVEKLCGARDTAGENVDWQYFSKVANTMFTFDDDNIVYEFHCYDPFSFTHQDAEWAGTLGKTVTYPNNSIVSADYESYWVTSMAGHTDKTESDWVFFETDASALCPEYNIVYASTSNWKTGPESIVYYDDIQLIEISPAGQQTILCELDFNDNIDQISTWSSDGSGVAEYCDNIGYSKNGCLKITGAAENFTAGATHIEMKENCQYIVTGYAKAENCNPEASYSIEMSFAKAENIRHMNKEYLEEVLRTYKEFSDKHNIPIYLGEFGANVASFQNNRGGITWVEDMLSICAQYDISFNYHAYHEPSFGLYKSYDDILPNEDDLNTALADLFQKTLKAPNTTTDVDISTAIATQNGTLTFNGTAQIPEFAIELTNGTTLTTDDFDVTVTPQTDAGNYTATITGKGNYTGSISDAAWTILPANIADTEVTYAPLTYNGAKQTPQFTIKWMDYTLTENDYTVDATGTNAGSYTAIITGIGNFNGSRQTEWSIDRQTVAQVDYPTATNEITYGEPLSAVVLSESTWTWNDETIIPKSSDYFKAYMEVDDGNYDYTDIEGYKAKKHRIERNVWVQVNPTEQTNTEHNTPNPSISDSNTPDTSTITISGSANSVDYTSVYGNDSPAESEKGAITTPGHISENETAFTNTENNDSKINSAPQGTDKDAKDDNSDISADDGNKKNIITVTTIFVIAFSIIPVTLIALLKNKKTK